MKIIDAIWEKRNLGVSSYEVVIEAEDSASDIEKKLAELDADYIVVKVPTEHSDVLESVQKSGFSYIEDLIHVEHDLSEVTRNRIIYKLTNYEEYYPTAPRRIGNGLLYGKCTADTNDGSKYQKCCRSSFASAEQWC